MQKSEGEIDFQQWVWALGSACSLLGVPFSAEALTREFPAPQSLASLTTAGRALGLQLREWRADLRRPQRLAMPALVALRADFESPARASDTGGSVGPAASDDACRNAASRAMLGIVTAVHDGKVLLFRAGVNQPETISTDELARIGTGVTWQLARLTDPPRDADAASVQEAQARFGFGWFMPELLRHRRVWREVLLASATLQLIALATPLFTQAIIDKVVVHRTQSTLVAIGIAMALFLVFSSLLGWTRQYLVLHAGNRVDAVLGTAVWEHLLRLPLRYFEHRPTGVVAARLQGVETIREFISGAAVSLVLDLPFLVLCLAVMLWYSVPLSAGVLTVLGCIAVLSMAVAPVFQARLNEQFLLGARNQAFVTEHIAGFETVKSLQMEPTLRKRYGAYLTGFLQGSFRTRQIANTYQVAASTLEQAMTLGVLIAGAYLVMVEPAFTVGMLVAFQMFAARLSQPVLRIVGLWTQFQQARLAVLRLGDLMNAPAEPYDLTPQRPSGPGRIEIRDLAFRYADDRPLLYEHLNLVIEPGRAVALMGPSGTGKSTLAKLMLGFYRPTSGSLLIDGVDTRHLSANELRAHFGVVPQETILFSGSILANLRAGNPAASFEQVQLACRMAGIAEAIEALPHGYDTEVGERGVGLSGGQKQRMAIARALLKAPKVLIFDEATSALDAETAEAFARTVNQLKGRVTLLFIAHALPRGLKLDDVLRLGRNGSHQLERVQPTGAGPATPAAYADR